jgi:hypothetical protein
MSGDCTNIPRVSCRSTSKIPDEFFRRNNPDNYLGQQVWYSHLHSWIVDLVVFDLEEYFIHPICMDVQGGYKAKKVC